jgi:hypothetical protein
MARTKTRTASGERITDTTTGRTGRTRNMGGGLGWSLGSSFGPCDPDGRATGPQFTTVTWDDGTEDVVTDDTLDRD